MASDSYSLRSSGLGEPAGGGEAVTPSDTIGLNIVSRGLYVAVAGDLTAVMQSGVVLLFSAVPAGSLLPIRVLRVNATGTTATNITAVY